MGTQSVRILLADMHKIFPVTLLLPALLVGAVSACKGGDGETGTATLPPVDTGAASGDGGLGESLPLDTSGGIISDPSPAHQLTIQHRGAWTLSPSTGLWTELSGTLSVVEAVDGVGLDTGADSGTGSDSGASGDGGAKGEDTAEPPACELLYQLAGPVTVGDPQGCAVCDYTAALVVTLATGDRSTCRDPELPDDGATWVVGVSIADGVLYTNYHGTGLWLPWYNSEQVSNSATFWWDSVMGVDIEDTGEQP